MADRDEEREARIENEAIIDAYGPEEQAMSWWCYLDMKITFPFKSRCIKERRMSPLKPGEVVKALSMADQNDCMHEMVVMIELTGRSFGVPLAQLQPLNADPATVEAVEDWHYWVGRGYTF